MEKNFKIVIKQEEIKVRKTIASVVKVFRDKKVYNRNTKHKKSFN